MDMPGERFESLLRAELTRRQLIRKLGAGGVALSLPGLLAACGGDGDEAATTGARGDEEIVKGGVLRIGSTSVIDSLNPYITISLGIGATILNSIYPTLVQYNEDYSEIIGDFATEWEVAPDGLTMTFQTASDAQWSDGQPLTARDAAWTINTTVKFKDGPTGQRSAQVLGIVEAEAPDVNTLVVRYESPVGPALTKIASLPILPEHIWSEFAAGDGAELKRFPNEPRGGPLVGGGPFTLTEYRKDEIVLAERNPNFYGQAANIEGYGVRLYANQDAAITALKAGEVDCLNTLDPSPAIDDLDSDDVEVIKHPGNVMHTFVFNSNPDKPGNRELLDPQVRLAFAHAIDRETIDEVAYGGHSEPAVSFLPSSLTEWVNTDLEMEEYDLDRANAILDDLGYAKGSDGIRVAGDHKMEYEVLPAPILGGIGRRVFQIIQTAFAEIGVRLTARFLDVNAHWAALTAPDNQYLEYDLTLWDWVSEPDPDFVLSVLTTQSRGSWSDTAYSNPEYDRLYEEQSTTVDQERRKEIVKTMQQMIYEDRPYIMTVYIDQVFAHRRGWGGFTPSPFGPIWYLTKLGLTSAHKVE